MFERGEQSAGKELKRAFFWFSGVMTHLESKAAQAALRKRSFQQEKFGDPALIT